MYFTVNIFASLRFYKWYLFNELSGSTSRRPSISLRLPLRPVLLFWHPFPSFQSFFLFASELRSLAPVSFGTAKVGNFFSSANKKWNNFYLLFSSSSLSRQPLFSTFPSSSEAECKGRKTFPFRKKKIKLFFFFLVVAFHQSPLPPKRSAKVGKYIPYATHKTLFMAKIHIRPW